MTDAEVLRFFTHVHDGIAILVGVCNGTDRDRCWLWIGGRTQSGYGVCQRYDPITRKASTSGAHRVAYEHWVGPIPEGMQLDHFECDVPPCCNPWHVRPATSRENVMRSTGPGALNARKTRCPKGHPYDAANTFLSMGRRHCKICQRAQRDRQRIKRADRTEATPYMLAYFPSCKWGHEWKPETTRWVRGTRICRICSRDRQRAFRLREKERRMTASIARTAQDAEPTPDQPGVSFPPKAETITDDILHVSVNQKGTGKK